MKVAVSDSAADVPAHDLPAEQLALAMRWNEQLGGKVIYRDE